MTSTSLGFNVPPSGAINITEYDVQVNGVSILNSATPGSTWATGSEVTALFELDLKLDEVLEFCTLPAGDSGPAAVLGAVINWKSTRTGLHGATVPQTLVSGPNEISASLDGSLLGGALKITISVILIDNPQPDSAQLSATKFGSRLWEQNVIVRLDGDGSQFPVSSFDFKAVGFTPEKAMWKVDISPQLDAHTSSAVRLKLNSGHPRVKKYLADPSSEENTELNFFMKADAITQMLTFALHSDLEQLRLDAEEEGTFAEALLQVHETHFPNIPIDSVKDIFQHDPSFVAATVQGNVFAQKGKNK